MRFPYNGSGICFTNGYFILLGLRAKKPFLNTWGFPGGGREKTDNSELDNAIRETKEETGNHNKEGFDCCIYSMLQRI